MGTLDMSRTISADESVIGQDMKTILKGIKKSWKRVFRSPAIRPKLMSCLSKLDAKLIDAGVTPELVKEKGLAHFIRPAPKDIFRAFKYFEVSELKAVLVGQDPYPNPADAQGLCFSAPKERKVPASLRNVYKALNYSGHVSEIPKHGDLTSWAKQGILMLNIYLTRQPDINNGVVSGNGNSEKKYMHEFWKKFTKAIVQYIVEESGTNAGLILWGDKAHAITGKIGPAIAAETVDLYVWGHPSPLSRVNNQSKNAKNFKYCDNFTELNKSLEDQGLSRIVWDPNGGTAVVEKTDEPKTEKQKSEKPNLIAAFTDGGCPNNGRKNAHASYGVYFPEKTPFGESNGMKANKIYGLVPKTLLEMNNNKLVSHANGKSTSPTNNRGELLAFIHTFQKIIDNGVYAPILIVTDSQYCMNTINKWIWKWRKDKSNFSHKKNPDLISILYDQLVKLKELVPAKQLISKDANGTWQDWDGLTIVHQNSHLPQSRIPKKGTVAWELYQGNETADGLCNKVLADIKKYGNYEPCVE